MPSVVERLIVVWRWLGAGALAVLAIVFAVGAGVLVWARQTVPAEDPARLALDSDETVLVTRNEWITFRSRDADPLTGVIVYPAARAEPVAYAPILHALAARGHLVVLCPMPLNLAVLDPDCAARIMARERNLRRWVIVGHGLGGAMAAVFARGHAGPLAGLVLWASKPPWFVDLSGSNMPVLAIHGIGSPQASAGRDAGANARLPATAVHVTLPELGPWGFGRFAVPGGGEAHLAAVLDATHAFLQTMVPAEDGREP
ncbi:MAG: alpha/beta hydrolase [Gammaproteobacteria bacterium]|nr:alpha/beta hydrolase [Gammaproteobacteria bacterium]